VGAFTDLNTGEIFLSQYKFCTAAAGDVVADEMAHFISGDANHGKSWEEACLRSCGSVPPHSDLMDKNRRRLGIPKSIAANIGNITGIQTILTDYTLLQQYRRFSQRILGNEGHWECLGDNKIRLYPTPKGSFPVFVIYIPAISTWRTPANKLLVYDLMLAETMIMLGNARGKFGGIPSPDGGSLTLDGDAMKTKGYELQKEVYEKALLLSDDPYASMIYRY